MNTKKQPLLWLAAGSLVVLAGLTAAVSAAPPPPSHGMPGPLANPYRPNAPGTLNPALYPGNRPVFNPATTAFRPNMPVRPLLPPIGRDPRTWSPYPLTPPIGSDPRSWSPYPLTPPIGSDPRSWSPYPRYPDYYPYPYPVYPDYYPYPYPWDLPGSPGLGRGLGR